MRICKESDDPCSPLCSHRMLLREDWDSVLECFELNSKTGDGYRVPCSLELFTADKRADFRPVVNVRSFCAVLGRAVLI